MRPEFKTSEAFKSFLGDLAAINVIPRAAGATEFGVISARSNDRYWLIPPTPHAAALAGFALFHPVSWRGTLMKTAATLLVRAGMSKIWARRRIALDITQLRAAVFDRPVAHVAFFTGTEGPHRKTAIEFIDAKGAILGYAKVTRRSEIARYLRNEAEMLRHLHALALESADIPECLAFEESPSHTMLVTDSRKSCSSVSPPVMTTAHVNFLLELAKKTLRVADGAARKAVSARLQGAREGSSASWQARFDGGLRLMERTDVPIHLGLAHGDFTLWNCFLEAGRLYVFDWEYADPDMPLGYDAMKFITSQQGEAPARAVIDRLIKEIAELYFNGSRPKAQSHCHLALLLHSAFYFERARRQGAGRGRWPEAAQFAELIDMLIPDHCATSVAPGSS